MPRRVDDVMESLNIRFPSAMREKIKQRAKNRGESEAVVIRELLKKSLETA
jgi:predicted DNA-binding protein